jgi:hypothetical protein
MEAFGIFMRSRWIGWWFGCLVCAVPSLQAAATDGVVRPWRPFYIIGHGANSLKRAGEYLSAGANALEVDVNVLEEQTNELCIGHGPNVGTGAAGKKHSIPIAGFLLGLHQLARTNHLSLVYFDCKVLAATPKHGAALLEDIREYLVGSGSNHLDVTVLISVGKLEERAIFTDIARQLGAREGLMVDGFSDPRAVSRFFTAEQVTNQAFCDGIVPVNPFLSQFLIYHAVRKACWLRDHQHQIRFVGTWSVNNPYCMRQYIKMGVDGIVVDKGPVWYNFCFFNRGHGLHSLTEIVRRQGNDLGIRLATPSDNPFAR